MQAGNQALLLRAEGDVINTLPGKPSVHQLGFADLMITLKLIGESPGEVVVLGIQPQSTAWSTELTSPVLAAIDRILDAAIAQLEAWSKQPLLTA